MPIRFTTTLAKKKRSEYCVSNKMTQYRELAKKIDSHFAILTREGITNRHHIFNRMTAFLPELHDLWINTTDHELAELLSNYPSFESFCQIVEELSIAEQNKTSREYDGLEKFNPEQKQIALKILGDLAQLDSILLEIKGQPSNSGNVAIHSARTLLDEWKYGADVFKEQLQSDGFHEYGVKTWGTITTENFRRLQAALERYV